MIENGYFVLQSLSASKEIIKLEAYKIMYKEKRRRSAFRRVEVVKEIIRELFPEIKEKQISVLLSRVSHHHYEKTLPIGTKELLLYDTLIKHGYNPYRVYKWFRLSILPENIQDEIEQGRLTPENALKINGNRNRQKAISAEWQFMEEAKKILREVIG